MGFRGLASHIDPALPDAPVQSHEPSAKLRRPSSFENTRTARRRTLDRPRTDHFDGEIISRSDNRESSGDSQGSFSSDSPRDRPKSPSPMRTYENELPSSRGSRSQWAPELLRLATSGRRKGRKSQKKDAAPEGSTRQRTQTGRQQATDSNGNSHKNTNRNSVELEGSDAHRALGTDSILAGSSQLIRGKASPADMGMRTLLVYRAILFATLCALAADTSCVYETEIGRRIVQVL